MNRISAEGNDTYAFGSSPFDFEELSSIQTTLQNSFIPASSSKNRFGKITSIEQQSVLKIDAANTIFRFNGWSDRIINLNVDYIEQELNQWRVGVTSIVRVMLKDGTYHENIGFAESTNSSKGMAVQEAKSNAVASARQQSLRLFGNYFASSDSSMTDPMGNDLMTASTASTQSSQSEDVPYEEKENDINPIVSVSTFAQDVDKSPTLIDNTVRNQQNPFIRNSSSPAPIASPLDVMIPQYGQNSMAQSNQRPLSPSREGVKSPENRLASPIRQMMQCQPCAPLQQPQQPFAQPQQPQQPFAPIQQPQQPSAQPQQPFAPIQQPQQPMNCISLQELERELIRELPHTTETPFNRPMLPQQFGGTPQAVKPLAPNQYTPPSGGTPTMNKPMAQYGGTAINLPIQSMYNGYPQRNQIGSGQSMTPAGVNMMNRAPNGVGMIRPPVGMTNGNAQNIRFPNNAQNNAYSTKRNNTFISFLKRRSLVCFLNYTLCLHRNDSCIRMPFYTFLFDFCLL